MGDNYSGLKSTQESCVKSSLEAKKLDKISTTCKNQYFENPRKISSFDEDCHLAVTTFRAELTIKKHSNVLTYYMIEN